MKEGNPKLHVASLVCASLYSVPIVSRSCLSTILVSFAVAFGESMINSPGHPGFKGASIGGPSTSAKPKQRTGSCNSGGGRSSGERRVHPEKRSHP